jgi:hypothetical protein
MSSSKSLFKMINNRIMILVCLDVPSSYLTNEQCLGFPECN